MLIKGSSSLCSANAATTARTCLSARSSTCLPTSSAASTSTGYHMPCSQYPVLASFASFAVTSSHRGSRARLGASCAATRRANLRPRDTTGQLHGPAFGRSTSSPKSCAVIAHGCMAYIEQCSRIVVSTTFLSSGNRRKSPSAVCRTRSRSACLALAGCAHTHCRHTSRPNAFSGVKSRRSQTSTTVLKSPHSSICGTRGNVDMHSSLSTSMTGPCVAPTCRKASCTNRSPPCPINSRRTRLSMIMTCKISHTTLTVSLCTLFCSHKSTTVRTPPSSTKRSLFWYEFRVSANSAQIADSKSCAGFCFCSSASSSAIAPSAPTAHLRPCRWYSCRSSASITLDEASPRSSRCIALRTKTTTLPSVTQGSAAAPAHEAPDSCIFTTRAWASTLKMLTLATCSRLSSGCSWHSATTRSLYSCKQ